MRFFSFLGASAAALILAAGVIAAPGLQEAMASQSKAAAATYAGPAANLVSQGDSSQCLDANSDHYPSDGDPIQLWSCNTRPEQEWALTPAGQLENTGHPGTCLDANSDHYPSDGDPIQLWSCNTHPEQEWAPGTVGAKIVDAAASMRGYHYCWDGGSTGGPTHGKGDINGATDCGKGVAGFDCTGLSLYAVYYATHIVLPHGQGIENVKGGTKIKSESQLEPGDIILLGGSWTDYQHVAIYAGDGYVWDANVAMSPYPDGVQWRTLAWETHAFNFIGAVRF